MDLTDGLQIPTKNIVDETASKIQLNVNNKTVWLPKSQVRVNKGIIYIPLLLAIEKKINKMVTN